MNSQKKEKILVAVTVVMVVILIAGFIYDRTPALLKRTLNYKLPEDTRVVDIDKHGFLFYRVGYEAKVEINAYNPEEILTCFVQGYDYSGEMLERSVYDAVSSEIFSEYYSYAKIKPDPAPGSSVWMMEITTEEGHRILHFMDIEEGDHAYLYIYYVR